MPGPRLQQAATVWPDQIQPRIWNRIFSVYTGPGKLEGADELQDPTTWMAPPLCQLKQMHEDHYDCKRLVCERASCTG